MTSSRLSSRPGAATTQTAALPYCIIGAGPCGLAAAREFAARGIAFDWFEREDDVGGNWYYGSGSSSMYATAHMISSKRLTAFEDFPMPKAYPAYPSHKQAHAYLRDFAEHHDLYSRVTLNTSVSKVEPDGENWQIETSDGQQRICGGLVIANGHHWDPWMPEVEGEFSGQVMHSRDYRTPEIFHGKRVLVVGAGNSGCDIAVEAAQHATAAFHSMRRGYHFLPKFFRGYPVDLLGENLHRWHLPLWLRRLAGKYVTHVALGSPSRFGLPEPDHKLFEAHPVINSQLMYHAGHGAIAFRPALQALDGDEVVFADGRREAVDLIVFATGYKSSIPFIDPQLLATGEFGPQLHLHAYHPKRKNLFVIGLIQPDSGLWPLAQLQARLAAALVSADRNGHAAAEQFRQQMQQPGGSLSGSIRYISTRRHHYEVDHFTYRRRLQKILKQFPT